MPLTLNIVDHTPLFEETELVINDVDALAFHVANLILGHSRHVQSILSHKKREVPYSPDDVIDDTISKLTVPAGDDPVKRDGWVFQMITWVSINIKHSGTNFLCQIPHDAPAQHGIDGLAMLLSDKNEVISIYISEDKYTVNPRTIISRDVWPEFKEFEAGKQDNKLVNRFTGLLRHLDEDTFDDLVKNDLYKKSNRIYRLGVTPEIKHTTKKARKKLFKGYDDAVGGTNHLRRSAITFMPGDIRKWMDDFTANVINILNSRKS